MAVITISRQFGAGGKTLGEMIAKELDYKFLDDIIIQEISKKAKVSTKWVKSTERTAGGKLSKFFAKMISRNYMERMVGDKGYIDEEIYVELLYKVIGKFAEEDNIVLMGRGSQYILKDFEGAFHLLLVAEKEDRIKFMQRHYRLSNSKAEQAIMAGGKKRANLYKKLGKEDYGQSYLYHLVLNMSKISLEEALKIVCVLIPK